MRPTVRRPARAVIVAAVLGLAVVGAAAPGHAASSSAASTPHRVASALPADAGSYQAVGPARILDTGAGLGAPKAAVKARATLSLTVLGAGGVPSSGVGSVVLNVTAAGPAAGGYLTAYPAGSARPVSSNLNFAAGTTVANLVVVQVGSAGRVDLYNGSDGTVRLVADVQGYYVSGTPSMPGAYSALTPARLLDTGAGTGAPKAPVKADATLGLSVLGHGGVPSFGVDSVLLNVTAAAPTAKGYLTAFPATQTRPVTSNLNFTSGHTVANLVLVKVGTNGKVDLYNGSAGTVRLVADVEGFVRSGSAADPGAVVATIPARVLDTGAGIGAPKAAVPARGTVSFSVLGRGGVPTSGVGAVILNLTAAAPAAGGYLTAYPAGGSRPGTSNINFVAGVSRAGEVIVPVGAGGQVSLINSSSGSVRLVADVQGYILAAPNPGLTWTSSTIDPAQGSIQSISCTAVDQCLAVDEVGNALVDSAGSWSRPARVATGLVQVSCATATFCAAISTTAVVFYDGSSWTAPVTIDAGDHLQSISCPTTTFCAAVDAEGQAITYDGSVWSALTSIDDPSNDVTSVSCPSATFCMAADYAGNAIKFSAGSWHAPHDVFGSGSFADRVSCASTTLCVAASNADAAIYDGSWETPTFVAADTLTGVSCEVATACVLLDDGGSTLWTLTGGTTWTEQPSSGFTPIAASCVSATFCAVVGASLPNSAADAAATFDGSTWSAITRIDIGDPGQLVSVSCATTSFCVAVDQSGEFTSYDGNAWSRPEVVYPATGFNDPSFSAVSCPTATFCMAVTVDGHALTYDGSTWSAPAHPTFYDFNHLSCASSTFCVALDNNEDALVYDASGWHAPQQLESGTNGLAAISCATQGHCVVVDEDGFALTYDAGAWSALVGMDPADNYLTSVSCPSTTDCTAIDTDGNVMQLVGATWSAPVPALAGEYVPTLSCVGPATCQAIDLAGDVWPIVESQAGVGQKIGTVNQFQSISCATADFCVAVDEQGRAFVS